MTLPLTNCQRVGAFMLHAGAPVYLADVIRGTRLTKNQASGALHYLVEQDLVEGLGTAAPGKARRFIVRDRPGLEARVLRVYQKGVPLSERPRIDFGPLLAAMGAM